MEKEEMKANEEAILRRSKRKPSLNGSIVSFVPNYCKGCGLCINVCPAGTLQFYDDPQNKWGVSVKTEQYEYCIGCKLCEMQCPDFAIFVNKAVNT